MFWLGRGRSPRGPVVTSAYATRARMASGLVIPTSEEEVLSVCHVLIIEDEPFIAMILQDLLEQEGATSVAIAVTERDAIASALACRPALITSDVKLLEGTGPHAVQQIHEQLGAVPVIFITGTPEDCQPCNPPGMVLSKPMDHRAVAAAFHELGPV